MMMEIPIETVIATLFTTFVLGGGGGLLVYRFKNGGSLFGNINSNNGNGNRKLEQYVLADMKEILQSLERAIREQTQTLINEQHNLQKTLIQLQADAHIEHANMLQAIKNLGNLSE